MHTVPAADSRFWDRYIEVLQHAAVPEKNQRWYVVRIERYLTAHPQPVELHTQDTVQQYLSDAGRDAAIPHWLFRQLVHALQLLFAKQLNAHCVEALGASGGFVPSLVPDTRKGDSKNVCARWVRAQ